MKKGDKVVYVGDRKHTKCVVGSVYKVFSATTETVLDLVIGDFIVHVKRADFKLVSEIEPFSVIAENEEEFSDLLDYQKSIWGNIDRNIAISLNKNQPYPRVVYFNTASKYGFGWDTAENDKYNLRTFSFKQFKNKEFLNMKQTGNKKDISVSPDFLERLYNAVDPNAKTLMEKELPDLFGYYRIGDKFTDGLNEFMLCSVDNNKVNFINVHSGRKMCDPVIVSDLNKIPRSAFNSYTLLGLEKCN